MADTTPTAATTPRPRSRPTTGTKATPKTSTTKPAPAKVAAPKAATTPADAPQEIRMELVPAGETKNFAKFTIPEELKNVCAGNLYVPLGATHVRVLVLGTAE